MMGPILGIGRFHLFKFHGDAITTDDAKIEIPLLPNLILLKFHCDGVRITGRAQSANVQSNY